MKYEHLIRNMKRYSQPNILNGKGYIYAIRSISNGSIHYIGLTRDINKRISTHFNSNTNSAISYHISNSGDDTEYFILEEYDNISNRDLEKFELFHIKKAISEGHQLLNKVSGIIREQDLLNEDELDDFIDMLAVAQLALRECNELIGDISSKRYQHLKKYENQLLIDLGEIMAHRKNIELEKICLGDSL